MPPRKRSSSGRSGDDEPKASDGPNDTSPIGGPPELSRNPEADPVKIHREYVQRRLGGGALPTPEAYENALDQWHKIPGAIRGPAGEVHPSQRSDAGVAGRSGGSDDVDAVETTREPEQAEPYELLLPATDPGDNEPYVDGAR